MFANQEKNSKKKNKDSCDFFTLNKIPFPKLFYHVPNMRAIFYNKIMTWEGKKFENRTLVFDVKKLRHLINCLVSVFQWFLLLFNSIRTRWQLLFLENKRQDFDSIWGKVQSQEKKFRSCGVHMPHPAKDYCQSENLA